MKKELVDKIVADVKRSKSDRFIELYNGGLEIKEISELFDVRYNHVYNVVSEYCRMEDVELRVKKKAKSGVGKEQIVSLLLSGMSVVDVCAELKIRTNYVYKIKKELKDSGQLK